MPNIPFDEISRIFPGLFQPGEVDRGMVNPTPPPEGIMKVIAAQGNPPPPQQHPWQDFVTNIIGGFNAKINPLLYQQQQENLRQRQALEMSQNERNSLTAFEQAQLRMQAARMKADQDQQNAANALKDWTQRSNAMDKAGDTEIVSRGQVDPTGVTIPNPFSILFPSLAPIPKTITGEENNLLELGEDPNGVMQYKRNVQEVPMPEEIRKEFNLPPTLPRKEALTFFEKMIPIREKKRLLEQSAKEIAAITENVHKEIDEYGKIPGLSDVQKRQLNSFHDELNSAARKDNTIGSTTQVVGVQDKLRKFISDNDPAKLKEKRDEKLNDQKQLLLFASALKAGDKPDIAQVQDDVNNSLIFGEDYLNQIKSLHVGDTTYLRTLAREITQATKETGLSIEKLGAQARESREYAEVAAPLIDKLSSKIETAAANGQLGPLASRYNAFMQGQIGKGDPEYSQLATEIDLLRKLVTKIHIGVRGAGSPDNAKAMKQKVDENKMDATTLLAGIRGYKTVIDVYRSLGRRTLAEINAAKEAGGINPKNADSNTANREPVINSDKELGDRLQEMLKRWSAPRK